MKSASAGTISGCLIWLLLIFLIGTCLLPAAIIVGGATSFSGFAIQTTGKIICPQGTTPSTYTYATTTHDEYGNSQPTTAYVLQCLDASGTVVKEDPVGYSFLWIGIFAAVSLILSVILAFVLAAPAGILIGRLFKSRSAQSNASP